jgi:hypothetical protein
LGRYCRTRPLKFSLLPRSHEWYGRGEEDLHREALFEQPVVMELPGDGFYVVALSQNVRRADIEAFATWLGDGELSYSPASSAES